MEQVWSQSPDDVNIAPPVRPAAHVGWAEVKKTYEAFWATLDELAVAMDNPSIKVQGTLLGSTAPNKLSDAPRMVR
jgi:hypothetical protein